MTSRVSQGVWSAVLAIVAAALCAAPIIWMISVARDPASPAGSAAPKPAGSTARSDAATKR